MNAPAIITEHIEITPGKGRQEGEAALRRRQLVRRFGALPAAVEARLAHATTAELETWGEQVLEAPTLAEVFGDNGGSVGV